MSYTPTEWKKGDVITATKLNKIENGIADASGGNSGVLKITLTYDSTADDGSYTCDKTCAEISAFLTAGGVVVAQAVRNGNHGYPFVVQYAWDEYDHEYQVNGGVEFGLSMGGSGANLHVYAWVANSQTNNWFYMEGTASLTPVV